MTDISTSKNWAASKCSGSAGVTKSWRTTSRPWIFPWGGCGSCLTVSEKYKKKHFQFSRLSNKRKEWHKGEHNVLNPETRQNSKVYSCLRSPCILWFKLFELLPWAGGTCSLWAGGCCSTWAVGCCSTWTGGCCSISAGGCCWTVSEK